MNDLSQGHVFTSPFLDIFLLHRSTLTDLKYFPVFRLKRSCFASMQTNILIEEIEILVSCLRYLFIFPYAFQPSGWIEKYVVVSIFVLTLSKLTQVSFVLIHNINTFSTRSINFLDTKRLVNYFTMTRHNSFW